MPYKDPEKKRETERRYREKHKEKIQRYNQAYKAANRDRYRSKALHRLYGVGLEMFEWIVSWQQGLCALCGNTLDNETGHVDHDHGTGRVRGVLHDRCNRMILPILEKHAALIPKARDYLIRNGSLSPT